MNQAETNLSELLKNLSPELNPGEFIFHSTPHLAQIDLENIICLFREKEGFTLIIEKQFADRNGISYTDTFSWITLQVHSALTAVGLTAAFSTALSKEGISCNVIAAAYHDHIFVKKDDAEKTMAVLKRLSSAI